MCINTWELFKRRVSGLTSGVVCDLQCAGMAVSLPVSCEDTKTF